MHKSIRPSIVSLPGSDRAPMSAPERTFTHTDPTDLKVSTALDEVRGLWTSHRSSLYEFLGVVYEYAKSISKDKVALDELRQIVRERHINPKRARSVDVKEPVELILKASMGAEQPSLRSHYKRLLKKASAEGVLPNRESFKVWLEKSGGIVETLSSRRAGPRRNDAIPKFRCRLLSRKIEGMSPIPMIGNTPPADTFVLAIYREECGRLLPCFVTDDTSDVNALLMNALHRGSVDLGPTQAVTPSSDIDNREAA